MTKNQRTDITIQYNFTTQEVTKMLKDLNLIPEGWEYYSVEVKGHGVSEGATFIIKNTKV
jgi:hypothetical protein